MQVTTVSSKNVADFKQRLHHRKEAGFNPNFSILFCSPKQPITEVQELMNQHQINFIGCTTAGEIVDDMILQESIVALLFEINPKYISAHLHEVGESTFTTAQQMGEKIASQIGASSVMILGGGLKNDGSEIVQGFKAALKNNAQLFGGLAGDDKALQKTQVFNNHTISQNGIAAVAFDEEKISVKGLAISGWKGIGPIMEVTKSSNNIVYEIDNTPVVTLYKKLVNLNVEHPFDMVLEDGTKYPLQVFRENSTPVLRAPLFVSENGGLMFPGGIKEGEKIRFCVPPDFDVIDSTVQEFSELKKEKGDADALVLFSCFARHIAFGPLIKKEIQGIHKVWNKPMIGFFTYGEIGNAPNSESDFHNETCSLLLIGEK